MSRTLRVHNILCVILKKNANFKGQHSRAPHQKCPPGHDSSWQRSFSFPSSCRGHSTDSLLLSFPSFLSSPTENYAGFGHEWVMRRKANKKQLSARNSKLTVFFAKYRAKHVTVYFGSLWLLGVPPNHQVLNGDEQSDK